MDDIAPRANTTPAPDHASDGFFERHLAAMRAERTRPRTFRSWWTAPMTKDALFGVLAFVIAAPAWAYVAYTLIR